MIKFLSTRALRCASVATPCDGRGLHSFLHSSARGFSAQAARLLEQCPSDSELPPSDFDSRSYAGMLQDCIRSGDPTLARPLHCDVIKRGACLDLFASNILLNAYVKSELLGDACILFDELPTRNTISFVTLIQGLAQALRFGEAVEFFVRLHREGHELNPFAFTTFLKLLVSVVRADMAGAVHACICKLGHATNAFVGTALVDAYSVGGYVSCAKDVFGGIVFKDMVSWTGIISCCAENGCFEEAMGFFSRPKEFDFAMAFWRRKRRNVSWSFLGKFLDGGGFDFLGRVGSCRMVKETMNSGSRGGSPGSRELAAGSLCGGPFKKKLN
ncbi:putative pentatricopeptide repeat-containing protein At5g13230, mitochondrial [Rhodamnia argentea]|uniref:Pentatricopeptide repeat-containing protein At5g13230, mitochondrial n=1 Tax=Rhodamnia argentea TaxID=178133 RepID=A0A8B8P384_9MYRT|nr:putative pentatricopeptide repeat-containing protein At5g13230, mitochondrial [Rhodamnia argentea]